MSNMTIDGEDVYQTYYGKLMQSKLMQRVSKERKTYDAQWCLGKDTVKIRVPLDHAEPEVYVAKIVARRRGGKLETVTWDPPLTRYESVHNRHYYYTVKIRDAEFPPSEELIRIPINP